MKTIHASNAARRAHPRRRGVALLLFALLVFVFLGVAALVVDVGSTSLAQDQMQSAVDTGAVEGLRLRDYYRRPLADRWRRQRVSELVQQAMDDDLHPTGGIDPTIGGAIPFPDPYGPTQQAADGGDTLRMGAGPLYHVSDGIGDANASALASVPSSDAIPAQDRYVDDPVLQPNRGNERHGDMLSGTLHVGIHAREPNDYDRIDFTRATNFGANETYNSIGFLTRMRRSSRPNALDQQQGISSRGPAIPLLFGMGSTVHGTDFYNIRREGLTARATAVAVGRPAIHVGPPPLSADGTPILDRVISPMRGVGWWHVTTSGSLVVRRHVVVAIDSQFWIDSAPNIGDEITGLHVEPDGRIQHELAPGVLQDVGHLMLAPCVRDTETPSCAGSVGTSIGLPVAQDLSQPPYSLTPDEVRAYIDNAPTSEEGADGPTPLRRYFPVYSTITCDTTESLITGFVFGELRPSGSGTFRMTKGWVDADPGARTPCIVAPDNASATLARNAPQLTVDQWRAVFDANLAFVYPLGNTSYRWQNVQVGALLAPALAR